MEPIYLFNTLSRQKEEFEPINPPFVGMYVCGPTVYSDSHLGHARSAITFDVLYRYLRFQGFKVRYVRNITDVGHLQNDSDDGEDKMIKRALLEQLEPMQIAQKYTNSYHDDLRALNCLSPDIEPTATGHIPEQIEFVEKLIENGFAYEVNGSVYFDVRKYSEKFQYAKLSRKELDDLISGSASRELSGQSEKRNPEDFALWKRAPKEHIMKWNSPWGQGFPGWHLECTVMSTKYLGRKYDIHGGGMDLTFPHHDGEIAQSNAWINDPHSHELDEAKYWIHNNMITIGGTKMSKSAGNFILLQDLFSGDHEALEQAYSPMTLRLGILQSHYRSVVDFSNDALKASEKGLKKLWESMARLLEIDASKYEGLNVDEEIEARAAGFKKAFMDRMNDDMNTAQAVAVVFDAVSLINAVAADKRRPFPLRPETFEAFRTDFRSLVTEVLGLLPEEGEGGTGELTDSLMQVLIGLRQEARKDKNFALSDRIRDELAKLSISLKDTPDGTDWHVEN